MTRVVVGAALIGVVQGVVAVLLMVWLGSGRVGAGWFAYTPSGRGGAGLVSGGPEWQSQLLLVPLTLAAVAAAGTYVAVRCGWFGLQR